MLDDSSDDSSDDSLKNVVQTSFLCARCYNRSHYQRRAEDPLTQRFYDLFECIVCGNHSWSPVTQR